MTEPIIILTNIAGILATANFLIYTVFSRWWQTWSGRAYWALFAALIFLIAHFVLEGDDPLAQDDPRELFAVSLVILALAFNLGVLIYKRFFWTPEHDVARDARCALKHSGR